MANSGTQLERTTPLPIGATSLISNLRSGLDAATKLWLSWPAPRKRSITVAAILSGLILSGILWYGLRTDWRTLFAGLDPEDARETGLILTQAQIPFDVASDGTIRVPAAQLDKARLATSAKGAIKSGRLGFELFDKPNWVGSEFDERVNYQRALEGELEHTIGTLTDIEAARVHLVLPHDSLFREEQRAAKASVVLKLRHATLSEGEAESIRNLVASAVDGLDIDRVAIVDAAGHLPLGPKTPEMLRLSAEQALEEKLISTLEPVTGPENVRASVTLDYDESSTDETDETFDPDQTATLTMQRTEQASGGEPMAAGVPGTSSNAPNAQSLPVYPKVTTPQATSKSESGTYGVSKTMRHVMLNPGRVRRMTAAIVVNDRMLHPPSTKAAAQWQSWSPDALRNLASLAQAAVGFDPTRGDVLTVQDMAFEQNQAQVPVNKTEEILSRVEHSPLLVKYVALATGLFIILIFGIRPGFELARAVTTASGAGPPAQLPGHPSAQLAGSPSVLPDTKSERAKTQEIFDQITGHLKRDPGQSSRLLQSWIHSE